MSLYVVVPDPFPGKGPVPAGAAGFYKREDVFIAVQSFLQAGDSVSLVGERRADKTSFLNYLLTHLPGDKFIPALVDAQIIAPKTDGMFLAHLATSAAGAIEKYTRPVRTSTLGAQSERVYLTFQKDLDKLRNLLSQRANGQRRRLVWLIDEIEVLRGYENTQLFTFLRSVAQADPDFQMVVAGYDVLYTLTSGNEWWPFFSAFRPVRLRGLEFAVAKQLIDDALGRINVTIEPGLYEQIWEWTGRKPYFLKWVASGVAQVLNQRQTGYHIDAGVLHLAQELLGNEADLCQHFIHLWEKYTTERQQTILSLIALQNTPYSYSQILNDIRDRNLIDGDKHASQHLMVDLNRLKELGFFCEQAGQYRFTSGCLQDWIKRNKPL